MRLHLRSLYFSKYHIEILNMNRDNFLHIELLQVYTLGNPFSFIPYSGLLRTFLSSPSCISWWSYVANHTYPSLLWSLLFRSIGFLPITYQIHVALTWNEILGLCWHLAHVKHSLLFQCINLLFFLRRRRWRLWVSPFIHLWGGCELNLWILLLMMCSPRGSCFI